MAGIAFKRAGHAVHILERNSSPLLHDQGAGLVVQPSVSMFFHKYDLTKTPTAVTSPRRHYLNRSGDEIWHQNHAQKMTSWDLVYHVLRANFDGQQSSYIPQPPKEPEGTGEAVYEYGRKMTGYKVIGDKIIVFAEKVRNDEAAGEVVEVTGDVLIGADGPSSTIRGMLEPEVQRKYVGYVAWRGTVPEKELPEEVYSTMAEQFTFYHVTGTQLLSYLIPGANGSMDERLLNWVWYANYPEETGEFAELMTDEAGHRHHFTLQNKDMKPGLWEEQKRRARENLPPQFAAVVEKTRFPFVQAITDVNASKAVWEGGKVVLIGDALAGFRPHTAASTGQAAYHALELGELFGIDGKGFDGLGKWEEEALEFAENVGRGGREMGDASQFGRGGLRDPVGRRH
ncbi:hypothetical protein ABW19_dt0203247 [Dactylella cylindrospora]|nr:hypothetical protein ABW19_dt0203247 [Dactylella cylindrospora]